MKAYIITEGSNVIGFGHITRCISLYQAFEEKDLTPILIINGNATVKDFLKDKKHEIFDWLEKERYLSEIISNSDVVILDSYLADSALYEKISRLAKVPVYLDDNKRIDYPRGIVVNGTVYADELNYPNNKDITYLLGSQYIPLRKEFWEVPHKEIKKNIEAIMITFGGDDIRNLTPEVLSLVNKNFPSLVKKVVIGRGFKNIKQIESHQNDKTHFIFYPDAEGMKQVMLESDVAISAGGQTLYELARVGVPAIVVTVADNQINNTKGLKKAGCIEHAGGWNEKKVLEKIALKLSSLNDYDSRAEKAKLGKTAVDGLGAMRVVESIMSLYHEYPFFDK